MRLFLVILGLFILSVSAINLFSQWFFAQNELIGTTSIVPKQSISLLLIFWGAYLIIAFREKKETK
ncbi:MAG: hypothetical protein JST58_07250 [Bacteroidetes bacterium]|nr:hypothetical protein [Bacteroidota bacterium]